MEEINRAKAAKQDWVGLAHSVNGVPLLVAQHPGKDALPGRAVLARFANLTGWPE